jgi:hypothetical protein
MRQVLGNPRMVHCLLSCESLVHVFANQSQKELFSLRGVSLEGLVVEVEITFNDVTNDFKFRVSREGHLTREHDI